MLKIVDFFWVLYGWDDWSRKTNIYSSIDNIDLILKQKNTC